MYVPRRNVGSCEVVFLLEVSCTCKAGANAVTDKCELVEIFVHSVCDGVIRFRFRFRLRYRQRFFFFCLRSCLICIGRRAFGLRICIVIAYTAVGYVDGVCVIAGCAYNSRRKRQTQQYETFLRRNGTVFIIKHYIPLFRRAVQITAKVYSKPMRLCFLFNYNADFTLLQE